MPPVAADPKITTALLPQLLFLLGVGFFVADIRLFVQFLRFQRLPPLCATDLARTSTALLRIAACHGRGPERAHRLQAGIPPAAARATFLAKR